LQTILTHFSILFEGWWIVAMAKSLIPIEPRVKTTTTTTTGGVNCEARRYSEGRGRAL